MTDKYDRDKAYLLDWMAKNCDGVGRAMHKDTILEHVRMNERYFRDIMSDLLKEGHVCATSVNGYWFKPLHLAGMDEYEQRREIDAIKHCYAERLSRAKSIYERMSELFKDVEDLERRIFQGQKVMFS